MKLSIESRQRTPWDWKLILYPFLAGALALLLWARPVAPRADPVPFERAVGVTRDGTVFVCERGGRAGVVEHCFYLTREFL